MACNTPGEHLAAIGRNGYCGCNRTIAHITTWPPNTNITPAAFIETAQIAQKPAPTTPSQPSAPTRPRAQMAIAVEAAQVETLRTRLTRVAPELADDAETALREALRATKTARASRECVKCGCTHIDYVEVQDTPKVLEAIKLALEQTEGRPGVAGDQADTGLVIRRYVASSPGLQQLPAWQALAEAGDLEALAAAVLAAASVVDLTPARESK